MSSTRSVKNLGVIASAAATSLPGSPVAGVAYRDATLAAADLASGWKYGLPPDSAAQNEWMFRISSLVGIIDGQGILGWCDLIDYVNSAIVFGSDSQLYKLTTNSGPGYGGAKDPVSNPAYWALVNLTGAVTVVRRQVFTSGGTYTPNAHMVYCDVLAVGAGGGGSGASVGGSQGGGGSGGGAGGASSAIFSAATIGASKTVTIGSAGAGGSSGGGASGSGGTTSFGALLTATGGVGGVWTGGGIWTTVAPGGLGGSGSGGTVSDGGGAGGPGSGGFVSGVISIGYGGTGGNGRFGGGGLGGVGSGTTAGGAGQAFGAGGGGAGVSPGSAAGGAGGGGVVIITEYCTQ